MIEQILLWNPIALGVALAFVVALWSNHREARSKDALFHRLDEIHRKLLQDYYRLIENHRVYVTLLQREGYTFDPQTGMVSKDGELKTVVIDPSGQWRVE